MNGWLRKDSLLGTVANSLNCYFPHLEHVQNGVKEFVELGEVVNIAPEV